MLDYQFKYIAHYLCIFYPEPFLFSAPTMQIVKWKGSCKEFLFVQLFFKFDNISSRLEEVLELMTLCPKAFRLLSYV